MIDIFFTNTQQSKINLLKYLHFCQFTCSVEGAATYFKLSARTIERQVAELITDFSIIFPQKDFLIYSKRGTIYLEISEELSLGYAIDCLRVSYVENSTEHTIVKLLLSNKYDSVLDLADITYQSPSSIYKRLEPIKSLLEVFGIQLNFTDNHEANDLNLIYEEANLRYFIYYFYWTRLKGVKHPYPEVLTQLKESEKIPIPFYQNLLPSKQQQIDYLSTTTLNQFSTKKNFVTISPEFSDILAAFAEVNDLSEYMASSFSEVPLEFKTDETLFYNFLLRSIVSELDSHAQKKAIVSLLKKNDFPVINYVITLLNAICKEFKITLPAGQEDLLIYYLLLYFLFIFYLEINPPLHLFTTDFSENEAISPTMERQVNQFYHSFTKSQSFKPKIDHSYFVLLMVNYMSRFQQLVPIKISVQFSKNIIGEAAIKEKIRLMFNPKMVVFTKNYFEADVIVSDCYETNGNSENYFLIEKINDNLIWHRLLQYVQQQIFKKNWQSEHDLIKDMI